MKGAERLMTKGCERDETWHVSQEQEHTLRASGHGLPTHNTPVCALLCKDHGALNTVGQKEALHVEVLCALDELLCLFALQVALVKLLCRTQVGAQGAVVAGDDDGAGASGDLGLDLVDGAQALLLVGGAELLRQVVLANTAKVGSGVLGEDVLGTSSGVLRGSSSNVGDVVLVDDLLVDGLRGKRDRIDEIRGEYIR